MMSWGPDDGKSILKYKQKDNRQESHVRDRVDKERSTAKQGWEHRNALLSTPTAAPRQTAVSPLQIHTRASGFSAYLVPQDPQTMAVPQTSPHPSTQDFKVAKDNGLDERKSLLPLNTCS